MNATNSSSGVPQFDCIRSSLDTDGVYVVADYIFSVLAIVINLLTCPPTVLLNALIITAVKTKRRLQTNHNILFASLAGTDLAVGIAAQPAFITQEIHRLTGGSPYEFCKIHSITQAATVSLCLVSLFHLALISVERYVAMKYSLRYESIVNKFRLTVAVAGSWLIVIFSYVSKILTGKVIIPAHILAIVSLLVIFYCHISVYFVCRRHMNHIKSEQDSKEERAKFLAERKVWKTTGVIIGGVFMCYSPGLLRAFPGPSVLRMSYIPWPLIFSCYLLNSFFNPVILFFWRSKAIRDASKQLLRETFNFS